MKKYYDSDINNKHISFYDFIKTKRNNINEQLISMYFNKNDIYVGDIFNSYKLIKNKSYHTYAELYKRNVILLKLDNNSYIDISSLKSEEEIIDLLDRINDDHLEEKLIIYSGIFVINHDNKFVLNIRPYIFKEKKTKQRVLSIR